MVTTNASAAASRRDSAGESRCTRTKSEPKEATMAMDLIAGRAAPGGLAPPVGPPGPPPPGLAALLGAAGPPPDQSGMPPDQSQQLSEPEALDNVLSAIDDYMSIGTLSEQDKLIAEKMSTMAQQLKASNEKMSDQLSGGSPAARKALSGAAGGALSPGNGGGGGGGGGQGGY